ncbi:hypothetical protein [Streptomyces werraensis]|uniref:hypothetical protein n=1 Tax=Streptomyces werraensis TaxID=68284 RepID=UPI003445683F
MDFNPNQFRQGAFRGFGDQAMRHHRVTPQRPQPSASPSAAPASSSGWSQPELPDPPATPAQPARLTPTAQARADISAAQGETRAARVATAQANAAAASHRQSLAEARASRAQQRAAAAQRGVAAGVPGGSVHGPQTRTEWSRSRPASAVPDMTPPGPSTAPSGPGRRVQINDLAYRNSSLRFGPPPEPPEPAPSTVPPRPTVPARPPAPPSTGDTAAAMNPSLARAGRYAGVGVAVAAKVLQHSNKIATDPKRSGSPQFRTGQGWMKS